MSTTKLSCTNSRKSVQFALEYTAEHLEKIKFEIEKNSNIDTSLLFSLRVSTTSISESLKQLNYFIMNNEIKPVTFHGTIKLLFDQHLQTGEPYFLQLSNNNIRNKFKYGYFGKDCIQLLSKNDPTFNPSELKENIIYINDRNNNTNSTRSSFSQTFNPNKFNRRYSQQGRNNNYNYNGRGRGRRGRGYSNRNNSYRNRNNSFNPYFSSKTNIKSENLGEFYNEAFRFSNENNSTNTQFCYKNWYTQNCPTQNCKFPHDTCPMNCKDKQDCNIKTCILAKALPNYKYWVKIFQNFR
ncbi:MAG: hypothetical protein GY755_11550 [Chloroflexi bacterium]|nr:hypothetical protein [Chloroflexota bacterium]